MTETQGNTLIQAVQQMSAQLDALGQLNAQLLATLTGCSLLLGAIIFFLAVRRFGR